MTGEGVFPSRKATPAVDVYKRQVPRSPMIKQSTVLFVKSFIRRNAFSIRKRANDNNPWIGTFSGTRSEGYAFAGDITGGMGLELHRCV